MSDASEQRDKRSGGFFWFYALLGSIFSALAIVSLMQKVFDIGLVPVMQEILDYYRGLVHPIMHWLLGWVRWLLPDWQIPEWVKDLYTISFVGGATMGRALSDRFLVYASETRPNAFVHLGATLSLGAILGLSFVGLGLVVFGLGALGAKAIGLSRNLFKLSRTLYDKEGKQIGQLTERQRLPDAVGGATQVWIGSAILAASLLLKPILPSFLSTGANGRDVETVLLLVASVASVTVAIGCIRLVRAWRHTANWALLDHFNALLPLSVAGTIAFFAINSQL